MTDSSKGLHEENLSAGVVDRHRAIVSLMEELEAADWYAQRAEATSDPELRAILKHNGDEEKEHAAMVLEWLRRRDSALAGHLQTYLYQEGSITEREDVRCHRSGSTCRSSYRSSLRTHQRGHRLRQG